MQERPIVEASLQVEYKLFINRLVSSLKARGKSDVPYKNTFQYRFNEKNYHAMLRGNYECHIKNVRVVEVTNTLYFLADLEFKVTGLYYDYWSATDLGRDIDELVLEFIKFYKNTNNFYSGSDKQTKADMVNDGLDKININDDNEIRKSNIYKNLISHANEVKNVSVSCKLNSEVHKRLKERDNVIPLMYINARDNVLNYPYTILRSSNPMSDANRSKRYLNNLQNGNDINAIVTEALRYTPYRKWLVIIMDKVSDEVTHFT